MRPRVDPSSRHPRLRATNGGDAAFPAEASPPRGGNALDASIARLGRRGRRARNGLPRRLCRRGLSLALAALAVGSCAAPQKRPPDIVVISLDTLRRDQVGLYRDGTASQTPSLDALAAEAVVFDDAWAQIPFTLASHMSMFTGLYPDVHGVDRRKARLAESVPTLPQLLQQAGYHTVGVVTNLWMDEKFGFGRGFDHYERLDYGLVYADRVNRRAFELLDSRGDDARPLFLLLHYIDPHSDFFNVTKNALPYYSPPRFLDDLGVSAESREFCDSSGNCATDFLVAADRDSRPLDAETVSRIVSLYGRGVSYLDSEIAKLVDGLRQRSLWNDALVLITSDHGEEFREHGRFLHIQPYVENLAVPLLIKLPRAAHGGTTVTATVETVDYLPTLLDAAGVAPPPRLQGVSLMPLLRGEVTRPRPAFGRDKLDHKRFALRFGQSTLVHEIDTGHTELYNRSEDPDELHDIADAHPERTAALRDSLLEMVAANRSLSSELAAATIGADVLSDDDAERLRAIGYVE